MNTSKTSITNQIAILEEIVDGENYWIWEQSIDVEGVMDSLDAQEKDQDLEAHYEYIRNINN